MQAQREFKLDAPSADTPPRNPLRATLSSTFYRAAVKTGSDSSGGGAVAPPPLPQRDATPKAVPATSPRGLTGRTGRSDRGTSKPRSSLEQALALKPLDAPPDVSTRSLQQERDAKRKVRKRGPSRVPECERVANRRLPFCVCVCAQEHAFDRSAASIWDEGKEALSISDLASATPLPKPDAGAVSVGGAAAAELSGRVSPLRDSTAEDVASSLERMLLNATSAAAADAVHASRAADAAALRASMVAQGAAPGASASASANAAAAAATTPGGASAAEAVASTAGSADTGASTPVPAPSPLRDAVRSSTARPSGHTTPSRGLTVSPVHAATAGAVALASPGEAPLPQASASPLRAVDGGRASPAATTPTRGDRSSGSRLPRPLAEYQRSVASLRSALGNVMSLYHELEAASLGAQVGGGGGGGDADVAATRDAMALMRVSMAEVRQSLVADGSGSGDLVRPHTAATGLGQQQPTLVAVSSGASQLSLSYARPHTAMGGHAQSQLRPGTAASVSTVQGGVNIDVASILEHFSGMLCNAVQQRMGLPAGTMTSAVPDAATTPDAGAGGNDGADA